MAKFNKEFTHKEHKFNTTVTLYTKAEKKPDGKVWHKIVTESTDGFGYYHTEEIENFKLAQKITEHRNLAVNYIDDSTVYNSSSGDEKLLLDSGFTVQV
jgi:hypothetical protein